MSVNADDATIRELERSLRRLLSDVVWLMDRTGASIPLGHARDALQRLEARGAARGVECRHCGAAMSPLRARGALINLRASIGSDLVVLDEQMARLPKKGAEEILRLLQEKKREKLAKKAELDALFEEAETHLREGKNDGE